MGAQLLAALLAIYLRAVPQPMRDRLVARQERIAQAADDGAAVHGVAPGVLLVVGFMETHLGTDDGEGGGWGAPISRFRRHVAGTPDHAARALAWSFRTCGSWQDAIGRYRSGLCRPWNRAHRAYVRSVLRITARVYARAGIDLPAHFLRADRAR